MSKVQEKEPPTYILSYPRPIRLLRVAAVALLVITALVRWVLAWSGFLGPVIKAANTSAGAIEALTRQPLHPLLSAHLSLLFVAGSIAFILGFLPDIAMADEGLSIRSVLGWKTIPWNTIAATRIASLETSQRRLILLQGNWSRWSPWPRLVSACMGAGFQPGLLLTSDIRDFGPLMQRIYRQVKQASPEAVFDDQFYALPARLVLEPTPTLTTLIEQARDEGWPLSLSAQAMAAVAGGLVLIQVLVMVLFGSAWWKSLAIVGLCALEWVIGALYLHALTELFPARCEFREGLLLYPLAQVPRALLSLPAAMLVAAGIPFLGGLVSLAAILWAVLLTAFLVQEMYRLKSVLPTMIGAVFQALFLFIILIIAFT